MHCETSQPNTIYIISYVGIASQGVERIKEKFIMEFLEACHHLVGDIIKLQCKLYKQQQY
jgi:hypothetical protein